MKVPVYLVCFLLNRNTFKKEEDKIHISEAHQIRQSDLRTLTNIE